MTLEQAKTLTNDLRGRFNAPFSSFDKQSIAQLYYEVLGKEFKPTTCQQCYHDALIEIYLYLKRENKMKAKCKYRMRAGFIINCPTFHNGTVYTNANLTDEVAEEYIAAFPQNADLFQRLQSTEQSAESTDGEVQGTEQSAESEIKPDTATKKTATGKSKANKEKADSGKITKK